MILSNIFYPSNIFLLFLYRVCDYIININLFIQSKPLICLYFYFKEEEI